MAVISSLAASPASAVRYSGEHHRIAPLHYFWRQAMWVSVSLPVLLAVSMLSVTAARRAALIGAAVLGYAFPNRPWRWALVLVCSQMLVMMASGSGLGLLPLGLLLLAILSLPAVAIARFGARMRLRAG